MVFEEMYPTLSSHASRIAKGNQDLMQDLLCMAYTNFCRTSEKGRTLSPGELINYMGLRVGELKSGARNHFGTRSTRGTKDVFHPQRYLNGDVSVLHLDEEEREGELTYGIEQLTTYSVEETVIFKTDFERFLSMLSEREQTMVLKRIEGYNGREISDLLGCSYSTLSQKLHRIGGELGKYFNLHIDTLERYGIA